MPKIVAQSLIAASCYSGSSTLQSKELNEILPLMELTSFQLTGQKDCTLDCTQNCLKVAPGSKEYCKMSCVDYCAQTDREDGLSGSISSNKGETGIFGGSIDGTTTAKDDRPPQGKCSVV